MALPDYARHRQTRTLVLAGGFLFLFFTLRQLGYFRQHYESHFDLVDPSSPTIPDNNDDNEPQFADQLPPTPPPRIALPGDTFYLTDALHAVLHPPPPPPPPFPDNVAVLLAPDNPAAALANNNNFVPLLLHTTTFLGPRWPLVLLTRRDAWVEPVDNAVFRRLVHEERRVQIHFLPDDDNGSAADEDVVLTKTWFWERFESAGRVLVLDREAILCASSGAHPDNFVEWDLIGAPMAPQLGDGFHGGLSLWNPKLILGLLRELGEDKAFASRLATAGDDLAPWEKNEDQWLYHMLHERGGAMLPGENIARTFAVESVWEERPMGYHAAFQRLTEGQKEQVLSWCPEAAMVMG